MDKQVGRLWMLVLVITSCETFQYHKLIDGNYILDVEAVCNAGPTGHMQLTVTSDLSLTVTVICRKNFTQVVSSSDNTHYYAFPVFSGDSDSQCVFNKMIGLDQYSLLVETSWGAPETDVQPVVETYLITCSYEKYGEDTSNIEFVGDSLIAPKEIQHHQGPEVLSTITLRLVNVLGEDITGTVPRGKLVKLQGHSDGAGGEQGLSAVACDVLGDNGVRYAILRAGCGDGLIFGQKNGFITQGLDLSSPYFAVFNVAGSFIIKFHCNFTVCSENCDGSSCHDDDIFRKRSVDARIITIGEYITISEPKKLTSTDEVTDVDVDNRLMTSTDSPDTVLKTPWWQAPVVFAAVTIAAVSIVLVTAILIRRRRMGQFSFM